MVRPRTWKLNLRASFLLEFSQRLSTMANERLVVLVRDDDTNDHPLAQVRDDALELGRNLLDEFLLATNDDLIVGWLWAEKDGQNLSLNERASTCGRTIAQARPVPSNPLVPQHAQGGSSTQRRHHQ